MQYIYIQNTLENKKCKQKQFFEIILLLQMIIVCFRNQTLKRVPSLWFSSYTIFCQPRSTGQAFTRNWASIIYLAHSLGLDSVPSIQSGDIIASNIILYILLFSLWSFVCIHSIAVFQFTNILLLSYNLLICLIYS